MWFSLETPTSILEARRPWCSSTEHEEMLSRTKENDGLRTQQLALVVNRAIVQQQLLMLQILVYQSNLLALPAKCLFLAVVLVGLSPVVILKMVECVQDTRRSYRISGAGRIVVMLL
ncbi:hypothetical protein LINPERHAP1_LOCUS22242 [Linum perenne]